MFDVGEYHDLKIYVVGVTHHANLCAITHREIYRPRAIFLPLIVGIYLHSILQGVPIKSDPPPQCFVIISITTGNFEPTFW